MIMVPRFIMWTIGQLLCIYFHQLLYYMFLHGIGGFIQPIGILGRQFIIIIIGVFTAITTKVIIIDAQRMLGIQFIILVILLEEAFRLLLHELELAEDMMPLMKGEHLVGQHLLLESRYLLQLDQFHPHEKLHLVEQFRQLNDK